MVNLNLQLKLSKKIKGEIINADSMQVYKQFKILTARPSIKRKEKVKHHLYGICKCKQKFFDWRLVKVSIKKIK